MIDLFFGKNKIVTEEESVDTIRITFTFYILHNDNRLFQQDDCDHNGVGNDWQAKIKKESYRALILIFELKYYRCIRGTV